MSSLDRFREDPHGRVFDELDDLQAGMLGIEGSGQHHQPMHHHLDRETGELWFITSSQTDLVRAVGQGAQGRYVVTGKGQDFWASLSGPIVQSENEAKLDEIWSSVAAAWFDKGREDHDVTLLCMTLREGAAWVSTHSPLRFGLEIARANMDEEKKPDIGEHLVIEFNRAA